MGGLNQLTFIGQSDQMLIGNPQMTFLKLFVGGTHIFQRNSEYNEKNNVNTLYNLVIKWMYFLK